jgi:hypothetical protein
VVFETARSVGVSEAVVLETSRADGVSVAMGCETSGVLSESIAALWRPIDSDGASVAVVFETKRADSVPTVVALERTPSNGVSHARVSKTEAQGTPTSRSVKHSAAVVSTRASPGQDSTAFVSQTVHAAQRG